MGISIVTGGAGFLGRALVARLLEQPGRRVLVVDDLSTPGSRGALGTELGIVLDDDGRERTVPSGLGPCVDFLRCDLARPDLSQSDLVNMMDNAVRSRGLIGAGGVDQVWHLASPASPRLYKRRRLDTLRLGTRALDLLLQVAHRFGARLLYASSSEVYGDPTVSPQHEDYRGNVSTTGERSCYDEAKRAGEAFCAAAAHEIGSDVRVARMFNTYGPGCHPADGRLVPALLGALVRGDPFRLRGSGLQTRSFCYVDDTVAGLLALMRSDERRPCNVGGAHELTVENLVDRAIGLVPPAPGFDVVASPAEDEHDPQVRRPDLSRLRALGWSPTVDLDEGLVRTAAWIRSIDGYRPVTVDAGGRTVPALEAR